MLLDLNKVAPEDKKIELGDKKYIIPGQLPASVMLKVMRIQNDIGENPGDPDLIEQCMKIVHEVFQINQPDLAYEDFMKKVSFDQATLIIGFLYESPGVKEIEKKPEGEDNPQAAKSVS